METEGGQKKETYLYILAIKGASNLKKIIIECVNLELMN